MPVPPEIYFLYEHLIANRHIVDIRTFDPGVLSILHKEVLGMIRRGETGWIDQVPEAVARLILEKGLFGWKQKPG